MCDYTALIEIIDESFHKHHCEYERFGISKESIVKGIKRDEPLSIFEIALIANIFGIKSDEVGDIFFTQEVKQV